MAMNPTFALQNFPERLEFKVAPRRQSAGDFATITVGQILLGGDKTVGDESPDAHAGLGKTRGELFTPVGLLDVLAEGEFDALGRLREHQFLGSGAVPKFDDA